MGMICVSSKRGCALDIGAGHRSIDRPRKPRCASRSMQSGHSWRIRLRHLRLPQPSQPNEIQGIGAGRGIDHKIASTAFMGIASPARGAIGST
jgi:hypothetical protein